MGKKGPDDDEPELLDAFGRLIGSEDEDAWEQWFEYVDQVIHGDEFDRTPKIVDDED